MNAALHQRLLHDMRRNPRKAVLLALLLGAALYFWVPLLGGLFGDEPDSAAALPPDPVPATAAPHRKVATKNEQTGIETEYDWRQLARAIREDPRMQPATEQTITRDPFAPTRPQAAPAAGRNRETASAPNPQKLGLKLTAVVVGRGRRLALIGGEPYEQGQTVKVKGYEFRLIQVNGSGIVLGRGGKQYRVQLPDLGRIGK